MLQGYEDIRRRIAVPPLWHDEAGVPRYDPFEPCLCANIYCDECAFVLIACDGSLHYVDPPRRDCCPAGPTMNCLDLQVLEYWRKPEGKLEWERASELEVLLPDDPGYQAPAG